MISGQCAADLQAYFDTEKAMGKRSLKFTFLRCSSLSGSLPGAAAASISDEDALASSVLCASCELPFKLIHRFVS